MKHKIGKDNVLIIDDFDRLDSEHIFRIFNILSIHQNYLEKENKFGFDKIIIVCSVDNIKQIFEHKYGSGASFEGYIEKFYSTDIFRFNNQTAIAFYCKNNFGADLDSYCLVTLGLLLEYFVSTNTLSIRNIIKYSRISKIRKFEVVNLPFPEEFRSVYKSPDSVEFVNSHSLNNKVWSQNFSSPIAEDVEEFFISSNDFPFLKVIQILSTVFGDYRTMRDKVVELGKDEISAFAENQIPYVMKSIIPILNVAKNIDVPNKIAFNNKGRQSLNTFSMGIIYADVYDIPTVSYTKKEFPINLGWNSANQYDGRESYYKYVNELFFVLPENIDSNSNKIQYLLDSLIRILKFLERRRFLHNLGLTQ